MSYNISNMSISGHQNQFQINLNINTGRLSQSTNSLRIDGNSQHDISHRSKQTPLQQQPTKQ